MSERTQRSPRFRLYIAVSVDGFIATPHGGVAWLEPFPAEDVGYQQFFASIGTLVMGRATYDRALGFGTWPYEGKRTIVLTSRPIEAPPPGVEAWRGDITALTADLRAAGGGDVWLVGGGRAARPFLDRDLVDRLELYVIPVLLGDGIPLFERSRHQARLQLEEATPYPNGIVALTYARAEDA